VPFLRKIRQLSRVVPWRLMQKVPFPAFVFSRRRRMALAMFRMADAKFIRWACLNAAAWKSPAVHHDTIQIHGDRAPLFPIALQKVDQVIKGGRPPDDFESSGRNPTAAHREASIPQSAS